MPSVARNESHSEGSTIPSPLFPIAMPAMSSPTTTGIWKRLILLTAIGTTNARVAMATSET